jgi:hypothetical protein
MSSTTYEDILHRALEYMREALLFRLKIELLSFSAEGMRFGRRSR